MLKEHQLAQLRRSPGEPNRVKKAMDLLELTQVQVADAIGVTQSHINKIANGKYSELNWDTVRKLSDYFGCDPTVLFPSRAA